MEGKNFNKILSVDFSRPSIHDEKKNRWKAYLERETKILNRQRGGGNNWMVAQLSRVKFPVRVRSIIRGRAARLDARLRGRWRKVSPAS